MITVKPIGYLNKFFCDDTPDKFESIKNLTGLKNETLFFQLLVYSNEGENPILKAKAVGKNKKNIIIHEVRSVPVRFAAYPDTDDDYLCKKPGLYPDMLLPMKDGMFHIVPYLTSVLWVEVKDLPAGENTISIEITEVATGNKAAKLKLPVTIIDYELLPQATKHVKWFHADCVAEYYKVKPFSKKHMEICEAFIKKGVERSINMSLVPIHTPSTDTRRGSERLTTQLIDIELVNGEYVFNGDKLDMWIKMMQRAGIQYFEITHLFTQWGASNPPKIMVKENGRLRRLFKWDENLDGYSKFLDKYLPYVIERLKNLGVLENCYFHISDEPHTQDLENYKYARSLADKHLKGLKVIDALSDFGFFESGAVSIPVPSSNHIEPFLEADIQERWVYYCCGQHYKVSNMFLSMASRRNLVLGLQMYLYNIQGFLQWGYNYYNSQFSDYRVNPFLITDGDGFSPAGDPFQVYPGDDLKPIESIRMAVTAKAFELKRKLKTVEALIGRDNVEKLVYEGISDKITFSDYPRCDEYFINLDNKLNKAIMENIK